MKKLPILFATLLLALFFASCSNGNDDSPITYPANQDDLDGFDKNPGTVSDIETQEPYTSSGNIYMAEEREPSTGNLILTDNTMLLIGTMDNGEITFNLPQTVDSDFLMEMTTPPAGIKAEPLGVKAWFYSSSLRLMDNSGRHIADMRYRKEDGTKVHVVDYGYFSEATKISGKKEDNEEWETITEYRINAKKGWNKIYTCFLEGNSAIITTDLSQIPDGLEWVIREIND